MKRKIIAALIIVMMLSTFGMVACKDKPRANTLVVAYDDFSSKFSPFFAKTAYDQDVSDMTNVSLLTTDRVGNIIYNAIVGETTKYNGVDYNYKGIADISVNKGAETTVYTIKIRDDIVFSDGEPMTIDDVIFSFYVLSDPTYTGSATFYSQPVQGMNAYRTNGIDKTAEAEAYMEEAEAVSIKMAGIADDEETTEIDETVAPVAYEDLTAGEKAIYDWWTENVIDTSVWVWVYDYSTSLLAYYYGLADTSTSYTGTEAEVFEVVADDEFKNFFDDYTSELTSVKALQLAAAEAEQLGKVVTNISGIKKTGSYTMTVTTDGFDVTTIYQLGISVAPLHYYGNEDLYDYEDDKFGFPKGDLSLVEAKTTTPMGAGAYKFVKFENGIIYFERNIDYYKGSPKIANVLFKEAPESDKKPGVVSGTYDISEPSFAKAVADSIKQENTNGELSGNVLTTNTVDFLGYGYIGINANNVNVGSDPDSDASKNLRRAFATLFAVYREEAVDSYYADAGSIINYPISNTSWAAPKPTDDGYEIAFSKSVNGTPLYSSSLTASQKYPIAKQAAKDYLVAAGYTFDEGTGKFTAAPGGAKMNYEIIVGGEGTGNHPSFSLVTNVSNTLAELGITLNINDPAADNNLLWDTLEAGTAEMWCAAWGATIDPDMYQIYHSSNIVGKGGTDSNHYSINDANLDQKIMDARISADQAYRKSVYKEALNIIADWAVEIPIYQRQEATLFSTARVDVDTITSDMTTFWGWKKEIEKLEMN